MLKNAKSQSTSPFFQEDVAGALGLDENATEADIFVKIGRLLEKIEQLEEEEEDEDAVVTTTVPGWDGTWRTGYCTNDPTTAPIPNH